MNNQKVLVTGGTGLLGSYLLRLLALRGYHNVSATFSSHASVIPEDLRHSVKWMQLNLPDREEADQVVREHEWVIHAAGLISYQKKDKYKLLRVNQEGTEQLVNAALDHGIKHFVYIGSIGALGKEKNHVVLDEQSPWIENEFSTSYGLSKYLGELECWRGAAEGLHVSVILPSVILGAGNWQRSSLQLVDRIINKAAYYPGGSTGFVDVRDVCRFILLLLEKNETGERWILNGQNMSYGDIYRQLADQLGVRRKYTKSPKWLARLILGASSIRKGSPDIPELFSQVYGSFRYDSSKSIRKGMHYEGIDKSLRDIGVAYRENSLLDF